MDRRIDAMAGIRWLKAGINLGRDNPGAVFGGLAMMAGVVFAWGIVFFAVAGLGAAVAAARPLMLAVDAVMVIAAFVLVSLMTLGYLRLVDRVESGRPARASDLFSAFEDRAACLAIVGFMLALLLLQLAVQAGLVAVLAPEFGRWYVHNLMAAAQGQAPPEAPAAAWRGFAVLMPLGLFFFAVKAVGLGQVALRGRGPLGALGDGLRGAMRALLPVLVLLLALVGLGLVAVLVVVILVVLLGVLARFAGAWILLLAIPAYIAALLAYYVVMFGTMYAMWRDIAGPGLPAGSADAGIEA